MFTFSRDELTLIGVGALMLASLFYLAFLPMEVQPAMVKVMPAVHVHTAAVR